MDKSEIIIGHLRDLAARSFQHNIYSFSNFLGENELNILMLIENELSYAGLKLWGGLETSDRVVARFGNEIDLGYEQEFPIDCLRIEPLAEKFGEALSHRDYLGALMNLGIERELIGDILIREKSAFVFCIDHISDYIIDNLSQVKHTCVRTERVKNIPDMIVPEFKDIKIVVSSERLDAVISKIFSLSRSTSQSLFHSKKVFVNGRQCESSSFICKPADKVSVRGYGKFQYVGVSGITSKDRIRINLKLYA